MRAKVVNEERMVHQPDIENMAFEIAQVIESTYSGDDVDYEPNEEDIATLEEVLEDYVEVDDIEEMSEPGWIAENFTSDEVSEIYVALVDAGFIDSGDFPDEDNNTFDLDQDIYDRNPDYDMDESLDEYYARKPKSSPDKDTRKIKKHKHYFRGLDPNGGCIKCGKTRKEIAAEEKANESLKAEKTGPMLDYSEAQWKMDKFMPEDDPDLQDEYYEILDSGNVDALEEFLNTYADEEILYRYMPKGGSIRGFAQYIIGYE